MKKITFSLLLFLAMVSGSYSQVQIGEGTNQAQSLPFEPYYEYSYTQSIYLASEINASGAITAIKWYYSGETALPNSQQLVVFMGQTDKEIFDTDTDFVGIDDLTLVYSGGITIPTPGTPGWVTITLTTPFAYDGTNNLVVAVDENLIEYDDSGDDFHNTGVSGARSIYGYSDNVNFDPADPSNNQGAGPFDFVRGVANFIPNIIFEGIQQQCPNPTGLGVTNLTTVSAQLKWAVNPTITQYNVEYGDVGFELGSGIATGTGVGNPYTISGLAAQTEYQFYVQASCGDSTSSWVGPYTFSTPCDPIGDFFETFDEATDGNLPDCWSKIENSGNEYAYVDLVNYDSFSPTNHIEMGNASDNNAQLLLVSPNVITFEGMRLKFRGFAYGTGNTVQVGTMTNPGDASSFVMVGEPIALTENYQEFFRTLDGATGNFVAIKHGLGGTYRTVHIDNLILEPLPTEAPECVTDINVTTDDSCGNFASTFEWSAVENTDGYRLSIGTTSGGTEALNNVDLGNTLSYSFVGNHNTTYYYSLVAYNAFGPAAACPVDTFSTAPDGCFCESIPNPEQIDNDGITNVRIGATDFPIETVTYSDNTEVETVDFHQNVTATVQITFETGFSYDTHIWIDYNDNYIFDANEKVYSGVSADLSPTTLIAGFNVPADAPLGVHRMRIGTADNGQFTPNPCYNDGYGITLDFNVNIIPPPSCLPPTNLAATFVLASTATLGWNSEATSFNVEYGEGAVLPGEGILVSDITANTLNVSLLSEQTTYQFYVQSNCGEGSLSPWAGPFSFTTSCEAFEDFTEDFTVDSYINAPECWKSIVESTSPYPYIQVSPWSDDVELYNSEDANASLMLVTPMLTDLPNGTHRIKFQARAYNNTTLIVGTLTDPGNPSSFTPVSTVSLPDTGAYADYVVAFPTVSNHNYVAFKHGGGAMYTSIYVDNVIWQPIPSVVPACVEDVNVTVNEECGNYASLFEWTAAEGADGYKVSIGTAAAGTDIINNQNIGNVTEVNFTGDFNTTYFYTLTPYNSVGDAVGCTGGSFATAETGCYCESEPLSFDNGGITNVTIGDTAFPIEEESYVDSSEIETVAISKDAVTNVVISFATDYAYDTHIWIDFNNNYTFEASELVYSGESLDLETTDLDASFTLPASATVGVHRMRIGTADSGQATPTPCYSGSWGVTLDFSVEVFETLSTDQFESSNFKVYPNPVTDILNLSYTQDITNVAVFNILGQEVITKNVNATQGKIDMSELAIGTYLVKV
ncbi:MAG: T9SS type A sorting domain-containing protein, partial [Chitinophagaceae bacterium]